MNDNLNYHSMSLQDAMYALALAKRVPDADLVDDFVRRYPSYASALTEFAIELAIDALSGSAEQFVEPATGVTNAAVSRAMSRFQNRLHSVRLEVGTRSELFELTVDNPFATLNRPGLRALCGRLGSNTVFVMKLRDRQIRPETITDAFKRRIANELNVPIEVVTGHFGAGPQLQASMRFKSDAKPQASYQQSFEEAVRSSGLSPEQQCNLLSIR